MSRSPPHLEPPVTCFLLSLARVPSRQDTSDVIGSTTLNQVAQVQGDCTEYEIRRTCTMYSFMNIAYPDPPTSKVMLAMLGGPWNVFFS